MSARIDEPRWQWRLLLLDIMLAVAAKIGVSQSDISDLAQRADSIRRSVERSWS